MDIIYDRRMAIYNLNDYFGNIEEIRTCSQSFTMKSTATTKHVDNWPCLLILGFANDLGQCIRPVWDSFYE